MAGPSEGGGMLEVVGARRRDVLTAGDVAETERDALGSVSEGAGPLDDVSVNIFFTISTNIFSPIAPPLFRRPRQRGCAASG